MQLSVLKKSGNVVEKRGVVKMLHMSNARDYRYGFVIVDGKEVFVPGKVIRRSGFINVFKEGAHVVCEIMYAANVAKPGFRVINIISVT